MRVGGAQARVHQHPVVHLQPGLPGQVDVRCDADADHHGVGVDHRAVAQLHARHGRALAPQCGDGHPEPQVDAVLPVQAGEDLRHLRAEHAQQWELGALQHGDGGAGGARGGSGLQADPAPADHHYVRARAEGGAQRVAVVERAQVVHTGQVRAGQPQVARRGAGGEQEPVVVHRLPVVGHQLVRVPVQPGHGGAQPQVDVVLAVPRLGVHEDGVALVVALQVALRQRWPLVGVVRLVAEQHDPAAEPLGAQRLHGLPAGEAGSHDGDGAGLGHDRRPSVRKPPGGGAMAHPSAVGPAPSRLSRARAAPRVRSACPGCRPAADPRPGRRRRDRAAAPRSLPPDPPPPPPARR